MFTTIAHYQAVRTLPTLATRAEAHDVSRIECHAIPWAAAPLYAVRVLIGTASRETTTSNAHFGLRDGCCVSGDLAGMARSYREAGDACFLVGAGHAREGVRIAWTCAQ